MQTKVIIDTDPGTDDALAIMMALNAPELDVQGLTTVGGNASLAHTTRNALRLLEYLGRAEISVYRGAARPLDGRFQHAYYHHGPGGLTVRLPPHESTLPPLRASEYIASLAESLAGELVLIALGPLTNVARAMTAEPRVVEWLKEIVVMGGAVHVQGNVTPHAEFNIFNDPHAARLVLSSGTPVTLVALDVCDEVHVTAEEVSRHAGPSRGARLAERILTNWFGAHGEVGRYGLCDPLAIVATVDPDVMTYRARDDSYRVRKRNVDGPDHRHIRWRHGQDGHRR